MAFISSGNAPALGASGWYNSVFKYAKQYIERGDLRSRFDAFQSEDAEYGKAIETTVVLAANGQDLADKDPPQNNKYRENDYYAANVFTVVSTDSKAKQYPITVNDKKINEVVYNAESAQEYAASLIDSLYQGWINDKNNYIASALEAISKNASATQNIVIGSDEKAYAKKLLVAVKVAVESFLEGVTGDSYGNTVIGQSRIAARNVVVVVSSATKALMDAYGLAETFHDDYLKTNVEIITSSRIAENTIIVTDKRNIIFKKRFERLVDIPNSDGSYNWFLNVDYFIEIAGNGSASAGPLEIAFPVKVIKGTEQGA